MKTLFSFLVSVLACTLLSSNVRSQQLSDRAIPAFSASQCQPIPTPTGDAPSGVTDLHRTSIYFELLGNGLFYSFNLDELLTSHVAARAGIGYFGISVNSPDDNTSTVSASVLLIPITVSYLFFGDGLPMPNSKFELGAGVTVLSFSASDGSNNGAFGFKSSGVLGTGVVGYRYQHPDGGLLFRADFTPVFGYGLFAPLFGLSIGYTF